ncbi:FkbM family methyltransferase [Hyphomonas sp.]|uniref:FkbM family methyltransferase n=1 Tax=Hyphomonas sp. TaxID=87 RepID=UPI003F6F4C81
MVKYKAPHGQFLVYPEHDDVAEFLNAGWYEFREIAFFYRYLRKGSSVLDIGAHCGLYSAIAKSIVGEKGYVLAVEPNAGLAPSLSANIGIEKPLDDIDSLQGKGSEWLAVAAMDEPGTVYLSGTTEEKSAYREVFKESAETSVPVPGVRIDDIDAKLERRFDLIKVDVEGVEDLVLAGMTNLLEAAKSVVLMIEFTEANQIRHGGSTSLLAAKIRKAGLGLHHYDEVSGKLIPLAVDASLEHANVFVCRDPDAVNARLASAPAKQAGWAEEIVLRGQASEAMYRKVLDYKNFRNRVPDWVGMISGSLQDLRGDDTPAANDMVSSASQLVEGPLEHDTSWAIVDLVENALGQLEGVSRWAATTLRENAVLLRQADPGVSFVDFGELFASEGLVDEMREGIAAMGKDFVILGDVRRALGEGAPAQLVRDLEGYMARQQAGAAGVITNAFAFRTLKPLFDEQRIRMRKLEIQLSGLQETVVQRDHELVSLRSEKDQAIAALQSEKDQAIAALRSENDQAIEAFQSEKDREIAALRSEKDQAIEALRSENDQAIEAFQSEKDQAIASLLSELGSLRTEYDQMTSDLSARATLAEQTLDGIHADDQRSIVIARGAVLELRNLVQDIKSDHSVMNDLIRSVRSSRVATLAAVAGTGPRKMTTPLMHRANEARGRLADAQTRIAFLQTLFAPSADEADGQQDDEINWGDYNAAMTEQGRSRRDEHIRMTQNDIQAMGEAALALKRSRIMQIATALGLPASRELDRMYDIYCARPEA